jgi:hypothetical protein
MDEWPGHFVVTKAEEREIACKELHIAAKLVALLGRQVAMA